MYLFVFMYLFIYLPHFDHGKCNNEQERRGGLYRNELKTTQKRERTAGAEDSTDSTDMWVVKIENTSWKIFVFIFYDHFCKISNLKTDLKKKKQKVTIKRKEMERKTCAEELPVLSQRLRLTYFCCILVIYIKKKEGGGGVGGFRGHKPRTIVC